ncbi:MAG TPA: OmpA family protein [Xanthomonadaceae bacterium]|nr:OmpA family protein [Xanthomonadaceae bacterium]
MRLGAALLAALLAGGMTTAHAQDADVARLSQQLVALDADPELASLAAYERLQARQALEALAQARSSTRSGALYVAERRVQVAGVAARTQAMQRELDRLDRERSELLVEASRRDAARARAEAERLRVQAQIQAEEAARLREQAAADASAMQDVEAALEGVAGAQTAKLEAAREREAALARQEAELVAGGKLPPSTRDARGEVFVLAGEAFGSGQSSLTSAAEASVRALGAYLQQTAPGGSVRVEGHTDSQGGADANLKLSQRRAAAVRDVLAAAGLAPARVQAVGRGHAQPVASNDNAPGRARNRRVEIIVSNK